MEHMGMDCVPICSMYGVYIYLDLPKLNHPVLLVNIPAPWSIWIGNVLVDAFGRECNMSINSWWELSGYLIYNGNSWNTYIDV